MRSAIIILVLAAVSYVTMPLDMSFAAFLKPCPAPLPRLGVTLLGQAAAGVLGWKLLRRRRQAK